MIWHLKKKHNRAYTLLEITMVIGLLLGLALMGVFGVGYFTALARAQRAEAILRQIENARLSYLSDNPTSSYLELTTADLDDYLVGGWNNAEDILEENGYRVESRHITSRVIGYDVTNPAQAAWSSRVRGFECMNCPD